MFGQFTQQISDLFGRNFVLAYLIPVVMFGGAILGMLYSSGLILLPTLWLLLISDATAGGTLLIAVLGLLPIVVLAISLMSGNMWILRRREGYRLERLAYVRERPRFKALQGQLAKAVPESETARKLEHDLATSFPPFEEYLLPFAFGNIVRAFEAYPLVMYGFEATRGWSRLLGVVPRDYRELVDAAKAEVDFLVNIWALSWVHLVVYLVLVVRATLGDGWWPSPWFAIGALASVALSARYSLSAAMRWGEMVKGAFDLFLPCLHEQLGCPPATGRASRSQYWKAFSLAFLTRNPKLLPTCGPLPLGPTPSAQPVPPPMQQPPPQEGAA